MKAARLLLLFSIMTLWGVSARAQFDGPPDQSFLWNRFNTFVAFGDFAVVSTSDGLLTLHRNPTTQKYAKWRELPLSTSPTKYKRFGSLLVYESDAGLLYFVDAGAMPDLTLLGTASLDLPYYDYTVRDSSLYVAMGFDGLWRYDLSDYSHPVFVDSSMLGIHYTQVEIVDSSLYALDDYNGIMRYDLTGTGFGSFNSYLYSPLLVSSFLVHDSTVGMTLVSKRKIFLGSFAVSPPRITDTIPTLGIPKVLMAIDSFLLVFDPKVRLIERYNLNDRSIKRHLYSNPLENRLFGDFSQKAGIKQILFPNFSGGISRFNLPDIGLDIKAENAYRRTGPITGLVRIDSALYTAGVGNPLEKYRILANSSLRLDKVFFDGLAGVSGIGKRSDNQRLYVYYVPLRMILSLRPSGDTLAAMSQTPVDSTTTLTMRVPEWQPDDPELIFSWSGSRLRIHRLPDSNGVSGYFRVNVLGNITDVIKLDSMIVIATNKRSLYFYRLLSRFDIEFRSVISTAGKVSHMRLLREPGCATRLLLFSGLSMLNVNTDDFTSPFIDTSKSIPLPVSNSVIVDNKMFTVGTDGISFYRFGASCSLPEIVTFGGRGGDLLSTAGKFLAISDGAAIHLYDISNTTITEVDDEQNPLPSRFSLMNYPNPFNPETIIRYQLPRGGQVTLNIYNLLGRKVKTLVSGFRAAGEHNIRWDGSNERGEQAASGVYFYSLLSGDLMETRKMVLIR